MPDTINSLFTESGDDVYAKPNDGNFSGTNWIDDAIGAIEIADTNVYEITVDATKDYIVFLNTHLQTFVAVPETDIITANAHGLTNGQTVRFKGIDLPAPLVQVTIYFVRDTTTNTFKIEATPAGGAINITDAGTGTKTFTAPSQRNKAGDTKIGILPSTKVAELTGEAEDSIAAAVAIAINESVIGTNAATAAAQATGANSAASGVATALGEVDTKVNTIIALGEADELIEPDGLGGFVLNIYVRGTTTKLVPSKKSKTIGGGNLTDPSSQELTGHKEQP